MLSKIKALNLKSTLKDGKILMNNLITLCETTWEEILMYEMTWYEITGKYLVV